MNSKLNLKLNLLVLTSLLTACSGPVSSPVSAINQAWNGIFSTRPQTRTQFTALYQLKNPALLENLVNKKIDQNLLQNIEKEQADFIAAAMKISSEIKVVYKYRLVLNAVTLLAPASAEKELGALVGITKIEKSGQFTRPESVTTSGPSPLAERNSVKFIGADSVHAEGFRGQGMKIGIIDTGIDYTHSMLGGPGTVEAYKSVDPKLPTTLFPNSKVVGGIDLVGTDYNAASDDMTLHIPQIDQNPIDEAGHGSHVAGTVAGLGDDIKSYSGVAPEASLYAIKVFGAEGSTSDEVVIAGLEYSANPKGDLDLTDHLDVVNLSLGSTYGTPHILYASAIKNLSAAGTIVVCSAGNSGANLHIVGAPSVAEDAISVAASVDNADHNWRFGAVQFVTSTNPNLFTIAIESPIAKPIASGPDVTSKLVYIGLAQTDLSEEQSAQLNGHIALIDRGVVPFSDKMHRAEKAGAIGIVVANNQDGDPFAMGGDGQVQIPAVMISKELGEQLKSEMQKADVIMHFKTDSKIERPELIDTLTDFSSEGPRSLDSLIKPEISAPGFNIISAKMGGGSEPTSMSGTSMAGPHIAGVMALIKQAHPTLTSRQLKSLLMGTAISITDEKKQVYPVSRQGSGRVQLDKAVHGALVSDTVSFSLGEVQLDQVKLLEKSMTLRNISGANLNLTMKFEGSPNLTLQEQTIELAKDKSLDLDLLFKINSKDLSLPVNQVDGWVKFMNGKTEIHRIPVLAMVSLVSMIKASQLKVESSSAADSFASPASLELKNKDSQKADVLLFNFLGFDLRKQSMNMNPALSRACDLQASGYRLLNGKLEIAIKTFEPQTTWNNCEISVQFDYNNDGIADQELVGVALDHIEGLAGTEFKSVLLDAGTARSLRKEYETKIAAGEKKLKVNYSTAIQSTDDFTTYDHSTIAVVRMSLSELKMSPTGELAIKIATSNTEEYAIQPDDFLGKNENKWMKLDSTVKGQSYMNLPATVSVGALGSQSVHFEKGYGHQDLLVLIPANTFSLGSLQNDSQMQVVKPTFAVGL